MWSGFAFNPRFSVSKRWFKKEYKIIFTREDQWNTNNGRGIEGTKSSVVHILNDKCEAEKFATIAKIVWDEDIKDIKTMSQFKDECLKRMSQEEVQVA